VVHKVRGVLEHDRKDSNESLLSNMVRIKTANDTLAGAANATRTSAEHTANLTDGGARGVD
jgi:hypothetical protein